ncbi:hypothetical protein [Cellulomonas sp. HZM]|uniref:hypothetical protein n=1 Tax=Cellulomonas sp. HZM TaxID=1454010 RepID=UPI000493254C|nr:hypothetical protein [Cellulomonas sp. HZM]
MVGLMAVGFVVVAGVAAFGLWQQSKRREALFRWSVASGWSYEAQDDSLAYRWAGSPFGRGDEREGTEVLRGTWDGMPALSFTYVETNVSRDSDGKTSRSSTSYHVIALAMPSELPTVELTPEGLGAKLVKMVGGQDIQFESDEFNRTYRVVGESPVVAHAIIHPRLMERLLAPDARGVAWRIEGNSILTWRTGSTDLGLIAPRLGLLQQIVASVPRHVWLDHGYDPAARPNPNPNPDPAPNPNPNTAANPTEELS